jgi:hypothetical protein
VHVVDAEHRAAPIPGTPLEVGRRIAAPLRLSPLLDPLVARRLETREQVGGDPITQDQLALLIELGDLLRAQVVVAHGRTGILR